MAYISVTLPDGSLRQLEEGSSLRDVAKDISSSLLKVAIAGKINGRDADLCDPVYEGDSIEIITSKTQEGLDIIRHSTAHLMAMAIQDLFPGTQITIGPVVGEQFYYDIYPKKGVQITPESFPKIEDKMSQIQKMNIDIKKKIVSRPEAIKHFETLGEDFKVEIVKDIPEGEDIKIYSIGDWGDLCRGPHVPSTGMLKAFKLMSLAGAYWKGDKDNPQLTRIYGTAWANEKELKNYLKMLEEAKKRDHTVLGKKLELYTILGDVAPGAPFFLPKGAKIYTLLVNYMREKYEKYGFKEIYTPQVMNVDIWKNSGHYDNYKDDMYLFKDGETEFGIKPMSCPGHVKLFMSSHKSYRDLPLRYAEFGSCHRSELSGTLHGLTRVRRFTQDDGHIFCSLDQVPEEITSALRFVNEVYKEFGFEEVFYALSTRPEARMGDDSVWDKAESALENALKSENLNYTLKPGDGAFYGPKIDFDIKDAIGRRHQCATIQLDFQMPERLKANYQCSNNSYDTPIMIHRAIFGSIERFLGLLIEHFAGHFPIGLSPVQASIITINEAHKDYAESIYQDLKSKGLRVERNFQNDKLGAKIRHAQISYIPYMIIIGDKELETKTLTVRYRDGKNMEPMTKEDFFLLIKNKSQPFWGKDVNQT